MVTAYIGLGGNLGDARATLQQACAALRTLPGGASLRLSSLYASAPIDSSGPDYLNAVASLDTPLAAEDLLVALQAIEQGAGRERPYRNAPRTLDLDVLLYGNESIQSSTLTVPHPRMWERAFVLLPLAELSPSLVSADLLATVAEQSIRRIAAWD